jgi:hypothetical protein
MRSIILMCVMVLAEPLTVSHAAEPDAANACVYLTRHDGARYSLAYARRECTRDGYPALPRDQYDPVSSWSSNAKPAGIVSALDTYRIWARLATRDERSEHGRYNIHGGFKRWSAYKWAEHAKHAYLTVIDALGRGSAITHSLEASLLRMRFATKQDDWLEFEQRKLSATEKADLLVLLASAETGLAREERMRAVRRTLEEAAREVPGYEEARRKNFGVFRLN